MKLLRKVPTHTLLASMLLVFGLVDLGLRCYYSGIGIGFLWAAHDPGKAFFHIVLLPVGTFFLIRSFPAATVRAAYARAPIVTVGSGILLIVVIGFFSFKNSVAEFFNRVRPSDISDSRVRVQLVKKSELWRNQVAASRDAQTFDVVSEVVRNEYRQFLNTQLGTPSFSNYWDQASLRRKWASGLSFIGTIYPALLLWLLFLYPIAKISMSESTKNGLLVAIATLSPWLPMRAYSEWFLHFGITPKDYQALPVATIVAIVLMVLVFVLRSKSVPIVATSAVTSAVCAVLGLVFQYQTSWFSTIAEGFMNLSAVNLMTVYVIALFFMTTVVNYAYLSPEELVQEDELKDTQ